MNELPMPLLDISTAQPSFQNNPYAIRAQILYHATFVFASEKRLASSWKSLCISEKAKKINFGCIEMRRGRLMIKADATLEPKCLIRSSDWYNEYHTLHLGVDSKSPYVVEYQSVSDSTKVGEREKLRRKRISQANKGNTPWNKGKKHSPETLQRIRERTRLAMQDPKVKMKLANLGHAQSEETRVKIGVGVRIGWERRREKLMLQETCHFEWQNLIAEASRSGFVGEVELQWDSYMILDEQLEQEWLESVKQRKKMPQPKDCKRAPKSLEQRRKISAAIAAKWTDCAYRDRVYSGLSKYHGTPVGVGRKPIGDGQPRKRSPTKRTANDSDNSAGNETITQNQQSRLKRSNIPLYKDPLVSSKLEIIKNIRAQREAAENKKTGAITRAKLLIAEAEKAANALEVVAMRSPLAQTALIETRKLIAEAIQSIESIKMGNDDPPLTSVGLVNHDEKETDDNIDLSQTDKREINGAQALASSNGDIMDFGFGKLQDLLDGKDEIPPPTSSCHHGLVNGKGGFYGTGSANYGVPQLELDHMIKDSSFTKQRDQLEPNWSNSRKTLLPNGAKSQSRKEERPPNSIIITKKWVRGKLVEVAEGG